MSSSDLFPSLGGEGGCAYSRCIMYLFFHAFHWLSVSDFYWSFVLPDIWTFVVKNNGQMLDLMLENISIKNQTSNTKRSPRQSIYHKNVP